jgi:hypothetical protein
VGNSKWVRFAVEVQTGQARQLGAGIELWVGRAADDLDVVAERTELPRKVSDVDPLAATVRFAPVGQQGNPYRVHVLWSNFAVVGGGICGGQTCSSSVTRRRDLPRVVMSRDKSTVSARLSVESARFFLVKPTRSEHNGQSIENNK